MVRVCRYYTPPMTILTRHDGTDVANEYTYDQGFNFGHCGHPEMPMQCSYETEQIYCPYYKEDRSIILRQASTEDGREYLNLRTHRLRFGVRVYSIVKWVSEEDEQVIVELDEHQDENARKEADTIFETLLEHNPSLNETPVEKTTTTVSYLATIMES